MDSKKKKLIIILSVVGVIVLAAVIAIAVIFTREPEAPPAAGDSVVYQTKSESFWQTFGSGYMTFEYIEEPAEPVEGALYGQVFKVWALNGGKWEDWLSGTWEMNADKTELTLTATWDESDGNATKLRDAESGVAKTYTAEDGKFYIGVVYPGTDGEVTFTLDPAADKVGEVTDDDGDEGNEEETPVAPEPEPEPTPAEPMLTMTATGSSGYVTANAKLELFAESQMNGTWKLSIDFGTGYVEQASGTYALNMTTYDLDLTVTTGAQYINNAQLITVATNGGTNYTCTVVSTAAGEITLNFTGALAQA